MLSFRRVSSSTAGTWAEDIREMDPRKLLRHYIDIKASGTSFPSYQALTAKIIINYYVSTRSWLRILAHQCWHTLPNTQQYVNAQSAGHRTKHPIVLDASLSTPWNLLMRSIVEEYKVLPRYEKCKVIIFLFCNHVFSLLMLGAEWLNTIYIYILSNPLLSSPSLKLENVSLSLYVLPNQLLGDHERTTTSNLPDIS